MKPHTLTTASRPLGFFLYGALWLIMALAMFAFAWLTLFGPLWTYPVNEGTPGNPLSWILGIPVCAYLFVIAPWWILAHALLGFILTGQSLRRRHRNTALSRVDGSGTRALLAPQLDTPTTRWFSALADIGWRPGWAFAASSVVIVAGLCLARFVHGPVAIVAGLVMVSAGLWRTATALAPRLRTRPAPDVVGDSGAVHLSDKYLKGVAARAAQRARKLQRAREAGRAPGAREGPSPTPFEKWGAAEADHALREHGTAAFNARKGVPGALDGAFTAVTAAMYPEATSAEAEQFVIDAAAFRGKKPVPVRITGTGPA